MSNRIAPINDAKASASNLEHARRESQAERAQRERARREATSTARSERRAFKAHERMELFGIEEPTDLQTDGHRTTIDDNTDIGAGQSKEKQTRVLSLAESMHRLGKITYDEWQAAEALRKKVMRLIPGSEGVSSYGLNPGRADPTTKAARKGRALTGYEINWRTGDAKLGERRNRTDLREAADLLFAMVGVCNEEGRKVFDRELATLLIRSVTETSNAVTLTEIGAARTLYTGEKQTPAAGAGALKEIYQRGAVYLGFVKGMDWDEKLRWVPA